jgi:hypothetical protein
MVMWEMGFWEWGIDDSSSADVTNSFKSYETVVKTINLLVMMERSCKMGVLPAIIARPGTLPTAVHCRISIRLLGQGV